ncbi:MAG: phosphotransferase [Myxococcales bacterium]|nr:phosphotransferase [Myxococcales bacterium]
MTTPAPPLSAWALGAITHVAPASSGLMHQTFFVDAEAGRFVVQRLHHLLGTPEILADYQAVTRHLAARGLAAPRLVPTADGAPVATDADGRWWRLTTRVPGTTHDKVRGPADAEAGARMLGRFHAAMADIDHTFLSAHPLHDTPAHLARLQAALADPAYAVERGAIALEVDEILAELPALILPADLPRRVVHGDPKISNVMFEGDAAVGLIDLDTCNRHSVLVDLGDAVRSWCRDGYEDELQRFHLDRFEAIIRGYAATGLPLTDRERALLPDAGRLITLELAARFARDSLEDHYFAWDATRYADRRTHNRARMRSMLYLARDMAARRDEAARIVARLLG